MFLRRIIPLLLCAIALHSTDASSAAPTSRQNLTPRRATLRAQGIDNTQRIDVNQISMVVTNAGSIAWDKIAGNAGLEFPRGSGKTALYAAGLWIGATVNGQTRVAISEYSDEFGPGSMFGTIPDDPNKPEYKVYRLSRVYANSAERDAALADYDAGAVPHGAPSVTVQGDGSLNIQGDQMLWCVFNDADFANHFNAGGGTQPLGVEVQLTAFAYSSPGPADRTIFLRYKIINKGGNTLQDFYVGMWSDPDLGNQGDDLVGCDPSRSLGYVYNATNSDLVYGATPPALGIDVIQGPVGAGGTPLPMTSFSKYLNGQDPSSSSDTYNTLRGLNTNGTPIIDPVTSLPTTFEVSGDPIGGTGWLDTTPSDRRMLASSGPVTFLPGQIQELTYAIVIGQGTNRLASIQQMLCADDQMQIFHNHGYALPPPSESSCAPIGVVNCPRTADDWSHEFALGGVHFTPPQLTEIAQRVDARSHYFDWGADPVGGLTAALVSPTSPTPQTEAAREFAAFLCNVSATYPPILPSSGLPVFLEPSTPIACSGLISSSLDQLAAPAMQGLDAAYVDAGSNPPALEPVNAGLPFWGGGAGYAADLFGSSIPSGSPNTHSVEIRFTGGATGQYAYRYLRTLDSYDQRVYLAQDYVPVPWTVWDTDTHTQLNGAFLENGGPPPVPTDDGTWNPDTSAQGGRELLWVMDSAYSGDGTPNSTYFTDPNLQDMLLGNVDLRYVVWPRLASPDAVIDPGDVFRFSFGLVPSPGADTKLLQLAALPQGDAGVIQSYDDVSTCLALINAGVGIGPTCNSTTATLISLVSADAEPQRVTLRWLQGGTPSAQIRVERREGQAAWLSMSQVQPDGRNMIEYQDTHITPGATYDYRLHWTDVSGEQFAGETSVTVPLGAKLSLEGFRPNPAGRNAQISFSLADASTANISVFDIAGRRRLSREVGALGAGFHLVPLSGELGSGLYVIRLTQGGRTLTRKAMIVR